MGILDDAATLVFLALAAVFGGIALYYHNLRARLTAQINTLETDLEMTNAKRDQKDLEVADLQQQLQALKFLASQAGVDAKILEDKKKEASKGAKSKSADRPFKEATRVREIQAQLEDTRRQLEISRNLLSTRNEDVHSLKAQLEQLQVEFAGLTLPAAPEVVVPPELSRVEEKVVVAATPLPQPEIKSPDIEETQQRIQDLEKALMEAQERANRTELELHKGLERTTRLDKRAHELLERVVSSEKEQRKLQRQFDTYHRMYLGLKGRFEIARDTLLTFQERFGVVIPTEVGVPLYGNLEDHVELEEEQPSARPRAESRSQSGGKTRNRKPRANISGDDTQNESNDEEGTSSLDHDADTLPTSTETDELSEAGNLQ